MKMNNKGFTLVELLAVMVILITISLVSVSAVTDSLVRREEKERCEQYQLAINAAKIYFSLENKNSVTVGVLKNKGLLKEEKTTELDDGHEIGISSGEYVYNGKKISQLCD